MVGKLQTFYDADFWYSATLRRNKNGSLHPFTLRIYNDRNGKLLFCGGYSSALEAKRFLERYDGGNIRWYTWRGFVCDN